MIDTNALTRLPNLHTKVTAPQICSLNRLTLLVYGHDWMGQAPAHVFQSTIALPRACREVKGGLSLADKGTPLRPAYVEQRKIYRFPCRMAQTQPEVESEGRSPGPPHMPRNDGGPASRQTHAAYAHCANR